jgi:hypothetical protein
MTLLNIWLASLVSLEGSDSNPARGGLYPKQIRFVLGTATFLLPYPHSLFNFGR